jgi:predicted glycoside hydrolase/deacetylase ChbG (UPF0249 family)
VPGRHPRIIVNADDFGFSPGVNAGIAAAHRRGIVTSASLMANAPGFAEAVVLAAENPALGIGVHLNLVRGKPLSPLAGIPLLAGGGGRFRPFRWRRMSPAFLGQAEGEYRRQIEKIVAAGIRPTHVDFEKHHAWQAPLYRLAARLAREYGIRAIRNLREPPIWAIRRLGWPGWRRLSLSLSLRAGLALFGPGSSGLASPDRLLGQCRIGDMDEAAWLRLARHVPPGVSEIMTHPGMADASGAGGDMGTSRLAAGRKRELEALASPLVRHSLEEAGVERITFAGIAGAD